MELHLFRGRFGSGKLVRHLHFSHLYIAGFLSADVAVFDKPALQSISLQVTASVVFQISN